MFNIETLWFMTTKLAYLFLFDSLVIKIYNEVIANMKLCLFYITLFLLSSRYENYISYNYIRFFFKLEISVLTLYNEVIDCMNV